MINAKKIFIVLAVCALAVISKASSISNSAPDTTAVNIPTPAISCGTSIATPTPFASCGTTMPTPIQTPTPAPSASSLLKGSAFVSDNTFRSAVLNCKIPDEFKGKNFAVFYEYWASDTPDKIIKTNIYRTYNADNFSSTDSYELFLNGYNTEYSFRAALVDLSSSNGETIYSDVVTFKSSPPPTAIVNKNKIYGYVAPEFYKTTNVDRSGFTVSINGGATTATTDSEGYFSFETSSNKNIFYNIKISKPGYIERNIDLGFVWKESSERKVNVSQNGAYSIMMCGDINNDNSVNMSDVIEIAKSFNLTKGMEGFNDAADFNRDNAVNMNDIVLAAQNFNMSASDYSEYPKIPYIELKSPNDIIYAGYNRTPIIDVNGYYLTNVASCSFSLNYNYPAKIVEKESTGSPDANLLANPEYAPLMEALDYTEEKVLSVDKYYTKIEDYKNSGAGEESGTLASIQFNLTYSYDTDVLKLGKFVCKDWDNNIIKIEVLKPRFMVTFATP